jgi:hypothetical protein
MAIMPLIGNYTTGLDWLLASDHRPRGLLLFLLVTFANGVLIEIGRRIRAPEVEREGVDTYPRLGRAHGTGRVAAGDPRFRGARLLRVGQHGRARGRARARAGLRGVRGAGLALPARPSVAASRHIDLAARSGRRSRISCSARCRSHSPPRGDREREPGWRGVLLGSRSGSGRSRRSERVG